MENINPQNPEKKTAPIRTFQSDLERAQKGPGGEQLEERVPKNFVPAANSGNTLTPNPFLEMGGEKPKEAALTGEQKTEVPQKKEFEISPIRTYTGDVADVVKTENTSVIEIAVKEEKRREEERKTEAIESSNKKKSVVMLFLSVIAIFLGIVIFIYFTFFQKKAESPLLVVEAPSLIKTEDETKITFEEDKEKFRKALAEKLHEPFSGPGVRKITPLKEDGKEIATADLFSSVFLKTPEFLPRSLGNEFLLGVHALETPEPFLILKLESYDSVYAGMLKWEETLGEDMDGLFLRNDEVSFMSTTTPFSIPKFSDMVVKNRDIRMLRNKNGKTVLLYAFVSKDILVITTNTKTLDEVAERLQRGQLVR